MPACYLKVYIIHQLVKGWVKGVEGGGHKMRGAQLALHNRTSQKSSYSVLRFLTLITDQQN
jgi:hypothetical protein